MMPTDHCALLPQAPATAVLRGQLCTGRYQGHLAEVDWRDLHDLSGRSALWRRLHHKRWVYVGAAVPQGFIGLAVVDLGWATTAFAYVFDAQQGRVLHEWSQMGLPGLSGGVSARPLVGCEAWFSGLQGELRVEQQRAGELQVRVSSRRWQVQMSLDLASAPPVLLALGPVHQGLAHSTHKTSALAVQGEMRLDGARWVLDGGWAALDASNGILAHDTAWRWASAHRHGLGFNLQQGYFGDQENALWLDGRLLPLGAAQFEFDASQPLAPWRVRTACGQLDARFEPVAARAAHRNLGWIASRYVQPVGRFHGSVRPEGEPVAQPFEGLWGVTEDHASRW